MARNVVWRELATEKNVCHNRREYVEAKRNHKTKRYREETASEESKEEEREYKRPKSRKKNLDKKKANARVRAKARARKRPSKRRKKKLIKCRTTYRKNQTNLNLYRVNRI